MAYTQTSQCRCHINTQTFASSSSSSSTTSTATMLKWKLCSNKWVEEEDERKKKWFENKMKVGEKQTGKRKKKVNRRKEAGKKTFWIATVRFDCKWNEYFPFILFVRSFTLSLVTFHHVHRERCVVAPLSDLFKKQRGKMCTPKKSEMFPSCEYMYFVPIFRLMRSVYRSHSAQVVKTLFFSCVCVFFFYFAFSSIKYI